MNFRFGAVFLLMAGALFGQYEGPSILSRGGAGQFGQKSGQLFNLRFFANVSGSYDTGLTPVSVDGSGRLQSVGGLYGVEGTLGLYGSHQWKRSTLGVDYHGTYHHYGEKSYFDGTDQSLSLNFAKTLTRRVSLSLRETAGVYSRITNSFTNGPDFSTIGVGIPQNELFDNRSEFLQTSGSVSFQKSARLSFDVGGDSYQVRRRSRALVGLNGFSTNSSINYRLTKADSVSAGYTFSHFAFPGIFGSSDLHTVALGYSRLLGRFWQVGLQGGVIRVESLGVTRVTLDPAIAAITGQTSGAQGFYRLTYIPLIDARLSRNFKKSILSFGASESATPGNGVYLTSRRQTIFSAYSYTGLRRWNVGTSFGYSQLGSVAQKLERYRSLNGGVGLTYKLGHALSVISRADVYRYETQSTFNRTALHVTLGIGFSPGELPLSLW